jgi:cardiolipin synthase
MTQLPGRSGSWPLRRFFGAISEMHKSGYGSADSAGGGPQRLTSPGRYRCPDARRVSAEHPDLYRRVFITMAAAVLFAGVGACASAAVRDGAQPSALAPMLTAARSAPAGESAAPLRLLTEPQAGLQPIYRLITEARSSVDLSMYKLADPTAEADLAADARRGVDVRVILDQHREKSANRGAFGYLAAHRVHVRWGPAGTTFHQKTLTVDDTTSVIMTLNLVTRDYPGTRDFAVIDTRRTDVSAIADTFNADFAGRSITPPDGSDLVWSPANAQASVLSVINHSVHTLAVENEEMGDPAVTSALAAAARRGVNVKIIMTADAEWDHAFSELSSAGAHIRLYPDSGRFLYVHAKVIVADAGRPGQRVLIGSQNFSVASLDYNRELGVLSRNGAIVAAVSATLARDYAGGRPFGEKASGARCTATATVYNASYDENNVYVYSNQPYTTATAMADGYSHSWETNGSGYALIYLNGPPPGALITVRVGQAICTTRD